MYRRTLNVTLEIVEVPERLSVPAMEGTEHTSGSSSASHQYSIAVSPYDDIQPGNNSEISNKKILLTNLQYDLKKMKIHFSWNMWMNERKREKNILEEKWLQIVRYTYM